MSVDPMIYAQIEAIAERLDALEADRCDCLKCIQRQRERERVAVVQRYGSINTCADRETRNAMIAALTPHECIVYLTSHATPEIVLDAPDDATREEWLQRVGVGVAMRVRLAVVERAGKLPRTVRVRLASPTSTWTRSEMVIDRATAARLRFGGLADRVGGHPLAEHTSVFFPFAFPAIGDTYRVSPEAVEVAKSVDDRFAEAVASGRIAVEPCTIDEDRARQLNLWSRA